MVNTNEHDVLVIERIEVIYQLTIDPQHAETAERVNDLHARHCPVAQSISPCIDVDTSVIVSRDESGRA